MLPRWPVHYPNDAIYMAGMVQIAGIYVMSENCFVCGVVQLLADVWRNLQFAYERTVQMYNAHNSIKAQRKKKHCFGKEMEKWLINIAKQ